ncbi:MAG: TIGR03084 family protein [Actinophytocola sp.]|nr:TIGR03084 family protein [Actinophytocola sp.]
MVELSAVLADLAAESEELDQVVAGLSDEQWALDTPAAGWTIAHQIAHLAWTDQQASLAASKPDVFMSELERVAAETDPTALVDDAANAGAKRSPAELLAAWRQGRAELRDALATVPEGTKVPWFGPPMSPASMATARIMETWAHGQDVYDALGVTREPTARLRHVAHIGVRTRDFAYAVNGMVAPTEPFRVELTGPEGDTWTWGPEDATQRVTGDGLEFCLLVTQRRHRADTTLTAEGADADTWLSIAQAFAGPPGGGRKAGQFT